MSALTCRSTAARVNLLRRQCVPRVARCHRRAGFAGVLKWSGSATRSSGTSSVNECEADRTHRCRYPERLGREIGMIEFVVRLDSRCQARMCATAEAREAATLVQCVFESLAFRGVHSQELHATSLQPLLEKVIPARRELSCEH